MITEQCANTMKTDVTVILLLSTWDSQGEVVVEGNTVSGCLTNTQSGNNITSNFRMVLTFTPKKDFHVKLFVSLTSSLCIQLQFSMRIKTNSLRLVS